MKGVSQKWVSTSTAATLAALAVPCVGLRTRAASDGEIPVGASKLGGSPDVPAEFEWPAWNDAPLAFLAQVDLTDAAPFRGAEDLPRSGTLSFFYDAEQRTWGGEPDDRGRWRVFWFQAGTPLERWSAPRSDSGEDVYRACRFQATQAVSLPSWDTDEIDGLSLEEHEIDAYGELIEDLMRERGEVTLHRLLGRAHPIQSDPVSDIPPAVTGAVDRSRDQHSAAEWRLLFQLDSDDNAEMMWGDSGMLYFMIRRDHLAERRFDDVWMVLQCC